MKYFIVILLTAVTLLLTRWLGVSFENGLCSLLFCWTPDNEYVKYILWGVASLAIGGALAAILAYAAVFAVSVLVVSGIRMACMGFAPFEYKIVYWIFQWQAENTYLFMFWLGFLAMIPTGIIASFIPSGNSSSSYSGGGSSGGGYSPPSSHDDEPWEEYYEKMEREKPKPPSSTNTTTPKPATASKKQSTTPTRPVSSQGSGSAPARPAVDTRRAVSVRSDGAKTSDGLFTTVRMFNIKGETCGIISNVSESASISGDTITLHKRGKIALYDCYGKLIRQYF